MLRNIPQCTSQPPQQKKMAQKVNSAEDEKPCSSLLITLKTITDAVLGFLGALVVFSLNLKQAYILK